MMTNEIAKSVPVSKRMVWEAYKLVKQNRGSAGIDGVTIENFDENMPNNLYKIWNRMSSGSYFPPAVRTVLIPKKQGGGERPLGIPTVADRIAQTVVKRHLEKSVDAEFHDSSFGYRPGKSAHDAVKQCEQNCWKYNWVIDLDIKGFFNNLDHELLLALIQKHTSEKWVLMYIKRWLKAGVEQEDGSIHERQKGTPQGGPISSLVANIYLHHAFDLWMREKFPLLSFERYADDCAPRMTRQA
jgi:RNA-directed DNA polymerase